MYDMKIDMICETETTLINNITFALIKSYFA